jgi:RTX calcium-binding nonapeptide repeat (4 copies)
LHVIRRGSARIFSVAVVAALVAVASAGASTIVGTSRADVLRGTSGADAIYGRRGNDRLYGKAGNDRLYGGSGADRISCGPGRDSVRADARDDVAADCELVTRPASPPPPHHPPSPPPPATPPPPPPSFVVPGHYVALTTQERYVHLEVYPDGRALTNLRVEFDAACAPPPPIALPFDVGGDIAIAQDGRFSVASSEGGLRLTLTAAFDAAGRMAGTFAVDGTVEAGDTRRECHSGAIAFAGMRW